MTTYSCVSTEFGGFLKDSPIVFQTVPECSTEFSGLFQTEVPDYETTIIFRANGLEVNRYLSTLKDKRTFS